MKFSHLLLGASLFLLINKAASANFEANIALNYYGASIIEGVLKSREGFITIDLIDRADELMGYYFLSELHVDLATSKRLFTHRWKITHTRQNTELTTLEEGEIIEQRNKALLRTKPHYSLQSAINGGNTLSAKWTHSLEKIIYNRLLTEGPGKNKPRSLVYDGKSMIHLNYRGNGDLTELVVDAVLVPVTVEYTPEKFTIDLLKPNTFQIITPTCA
jgi:hypothetical protein